MFRVSPDPETALALSPGDTVGAWTLAEPIGRLAAWRVYRAAQAAGGKTERLLLEYWPTRLLTRRGRKAVPQSGAWNEALKDDARRLVERGRAWGAASDPALVPVVDSFEAHGTAWLAIEAPRGQRLTELTAPGQAWPADLIAPTAARLAQALDALRAAGLAHGAISPDWLVATPGKAWRIRLIGPATDGLTLTGLSRAADEVRAYAPLELERGEWRPDDRTDLYSAAAVLIRLATGQRPLLAAARLGKDTAPKLKDAAGLGLAPALATAIDKAFALLPGDRKTGLDAWRAAAGAASRSPVARFAPAKPKAAKPAAAVPAFEEPPIFLREEPVEIEAEFDDLGLPDAPHDDDPIYLPARYNSRARHEGQHRRPAIHTLLWKTVSRPERKGLRLGLLAALVLALVAAASVLGDRAGLTLPSLAPRPADDPPIAARPIDGSPDAEGRKLAAAPPPVEGPAAPKPAPQPPEPVAAPEPAPPKIVPAAAIERPPAPSKAVSRPAAPTLRPGEFLDADNRICRASTSQDCAPARPAQPTSFIQELLDYGYPEGGDPTRLARGRADQVCGARGGRLASSLYLGPNRCARGSCVADLSFSCSKPPPAGAMLPAACRTVVRNDCLVGGVWTPQGR